MSQLVKKLRSEHRVSHDTAPQGHSGLRALFEVSAEAVWCCSQPSDRQPRTLVATESPLLREKEQKDLLSQRCAGDSSLDVATTGERNTLCSLEGSPEPLTPRISQHYLGANEDCLHCHY